VAAHAIGWVVQVAVGGNYAGEGGEVGLEDAAVLEAPLVEAVLEVQVDRREGVEVLAVEVPIWDFVGVGARQGSVLVVLVAVAVHGQMGCKGDGSESWVYCLLLSVCLALTHLALVPPEKIAVPFAENLEPQQLWVPGSAVDQELMRGRSRLRGRRSRQVLSAPKSLGKTLRGYSQELRRTLSETPSSSWS
jgi:hypothetical protein